MTNAVDFDVCDEVVPRMHAAEVEPHSSLPTNTLQVSLFPAAEVLVPLVVHVDPVALALPGASGDSLPSIASPSSACSVYPGTVELVLSALRDLCFSSIG